MNYYNEFDPKAAAWLRVLIEEKQIPKGEVDERSIIEIKPNELAGFTQCHFFAGIGGWSLALKLAGWPEDREVWTGSCPCQPFSCAGRGMAEDDERHLWPDFRNLIGQCRPAIVFGEQTESKDGCRWLAGVSADLEAGGYRFAASDLCAAGISSPQRRQRLYWMANDQGKGRSGVESKLKANISERSWVGCNSSNGRMVQSNGTGRNAGRQASASNRYGSAIEPASSIGCLGDTNRSRLEGHGRHEQLDDSKGRQGTQRHCAASGFWDSFRIIETTDGKKRRIPIEPAFFPLAHGLPGRVAFLKGFGNSICPQLAAEFIQACDEAIQII